MPVTRASIKKELNKIKETSNKKSIKKTELKKKQYSFDDLILFKKNPIVDKKKRNFSLNFPIETNYKVRSYTKKYLKERKLYQHEVIKTANKRLFDEVELMEYDNKDTKILFNENIICHILKKNRLPPKRNSDIMTLISHTPPKKTILKKSIP